MNDNLPVTGFSAAKALDGRVLGEQIGLLQPQPVAMTAPIEMKFDGGKLRWGLIMVGMQAAIRGVVAVGTFGARKYADDSWQTVPNAQKRYKDALYRHLDNIAERGDQSTDIDFVDGVDKGSGLLEWYHVAWNALALSWFASREAHRQAREATR